MRLAALALAAILLAACGSTPAAQPTSLASPSAEPTTPLSPAPTPAPTRAPTPAPIVTGKPSPPTIVPSPPEATGEPLAKATTLSGTLRADAELEGGCAWLDTNRGKIQVLYPPGYNLDIARLRLTGPDGEVIASAGDIVTIRGAPAPNMMSICQIGPIWRAVEVLPNQ